MPQPRLATKRAGLPPIGTQQRIAGAVHQVIAEEFGDIARQMCSYYAAVGTTVASVITGRTYTCQVGSVVVTTVPESEMGDGQGAAAFAMMADDPLVPGLEFHAWFAGQFGQHQAGITRRTHVLHQCPGAPACTTRRSSGRPVEPLSLASSSSRTSKP